MGLSGYLHTQSLNLLSHCGRLIWLLDLIRGFQLLRACLLPKYVEAGVEFVLFIILRLEPLD